MTADVSCISSKLLLGFVQKAECSPKAVPACREASEPLFEEQSDAVKVSETLCLWLRWRRQPSEGASVSRHEKGFLQNSIKYLLVILERL